MTTSVSAPLTAAQQIFKDLIWDPAIKMGEVALEGLAPLLANPIMAEIDDEIIGAVMDYAFTQLILVVDLTSLQFTEIVNKAAYVKASESLAVIAHDSGINSPAYQAARDAELASQSIFTQFK